MNKTLTVTLKTIFWIIILWFVGYFVFGEYISLEFSDYTFAQIFPRILTFATGASIYFLILLTIRKSDGWSLKNIIKFLVALIFACLPFILFKYYSSVGNCQNWEVNKKIKTTLYQSTSSSREYIKSIVYYCPEMNNESEKIYRVMSITPYFNTYSEIDTLKLNPKNWKKIEK